MKSTNTQKSYRRGGPIVEAIAAIVFEVANLRILAEHTDVETSALPVG